MAAGERARFGGCRLAAAGANDAGPSMVTVYSTAQGPEQLSPSLLVETFMHDQMLRPPVFHN